MTNTGSSFLTLHKHDNVQSSFTQQEVRGAQPVNLKTVRKIFPDNGPTFCSSFAVFNPEKVLSNAD